MYIRNRTRSSIEPIEPDVSDFDVTFRIYDYAESFGSIRGREAYSV